MSLIWRLVAMTLVGKVLMERRRAGTRPAGAGATAGQTPAASSETRRAGAVAQDEPVPAQGTDRPGPDTPLELEPGDWKSTTKRALKEVKDDRVPLAAAGMAYYFFLAIVPAFIAVVGVMGIVGVDPQPMIDSIRSTFPGDAGAVIAQPLERADETSQGASVTTALVGIAVALWSASSGMVGLQSGLNIAYDVPEDRKFVGKRAVAILLIIATGLLGGVPSPIFTFGESTFFVVLGWMLTIVAVVIMFSLFYYIAPNRESPQWQWVTGGGLVGALLWILSAVAFGIYVEGFGGEGKYAETYGALAGVVVLILLLYISSLAVLIGGELNAELERQAAIADSRS
jgi:membrane protein